MYIFQGFYRPYVTNYVRCCFNMGVMSVIIIFYADS